MPSPTPTKERTARMETKRKRGPRNSSDAELAKVGVEDANLPDNFVLRC